MKRIKHATLQQEFVILSGAKDLRLLFTPSPHQDLGCPRSLAFGDRGSHSVNPPQDGVPHSKVRCSPANFRVGSEIASPQAPQRGRETVAPGASLGTLI